MPLWGDRIAAIVGTGSLFSAKSITVKLSWDRVRIADILGVIG